MAQFKVYKFADIQKLEQFLNGGLRAGADPRKGFSGLVGKTLIFTLPAAVTVTFTQGAEKFNFLTFPEVKAQIEAAVGAPKVLQDGDSMVFIESSPSAGVSITGGTGLDVLGLKGTETSKVYSFPDGAAAAVVPPWVHTYTDGAFHILITRE